MNEVNIRGEVKFVDEVREYGNNGFRKHQVVTEDGITLFQWNSLKKPLKKARDFRLVTKYQLMPVSTEESGLGRMA